MLRKDVAFAKRAQLTIDAAALFAFLSTPHNHLGLQPLVSQVSNLQEFAAANGATGYRYTFVERLPIAGPLAWYQPSQAQMIPQPDTYQIEFVIRSFPGLRMHCLYRLTPLLQGTEITETVNISVYSFLAPYVLKMAEQAHEAMFRRLQERFNRQPFVDSTIR
ncbi:MAG: hypothetical protein IPL78_21755 [Chloroflexi bacterium]|nr:hypothetical protein [Chloroflexota bacterium]